MIQHLATARRCGGAIAALLLAPCAALVGQTNDESRLTMGISAGWIASAQLWDIPRQEISSPFGDPDFYHLHRELRSDITISGHGTYFRGPHLGFTGEFTYLGLGTTDACTVVQNGGNAELQAACDALQGVQHSAVVTTAQGGVVLRPWSRTFIQPYLTGTAGVAFTPRSTVEMTSIYGNIGDTLVTLNIYQDDHTPEIRPSWTLGAGFATAPSSGYQLRIEVRETWLAQTVVTAATSRQGLLPPTRSVLKGFPSVLVAFDVVLEKRRGRRY
jgi:hypothetical protein